jgi:hypothetical protein
MDGDRTYREDGAFKQYIPGRYESQTATFAVRASTCITKKKPQKLKFWDHINPEV